MRVIDIAIQRLKHDVEEETRYFPEVVSQPQGDMEYVINYRCVVLLNSLFSLIHLYC